MFIAAIVKDGIVCRLYGWRVSCILLRVGRHRWRIIVRICILIVGVIVIICTVGTSANGGAVIQILIIEFDVWQRRLRQWVMD